MLTAPKYEWHEMERNGTFFEGELIWSPGFALFP